MLHFWAVLLTDELINDFYYVSLDTSVSLHVAGGIGFYYQVSGTQASCINAPLKYYKVLIISPFTGPSPNDFCDI